MQQNQPKKSGAEVEFFTEYGDANRYKIIEVVGKGSYGVVCAAIDTHTGEKVAIKKIQDIFEHISDAIRILREIKLLRLLRHPDIVEIKRIMLPPSRREFKDIYVVFELMESDLHQVIKANDDLTREHHQFFLYQMLRALKYMHTANVYHRDLKPKNVLANANCKLKVCDFGLARVAFNDTPTTVYWTFLFRAHFLLETENHSFSAIEQFKKQFAHLEESGGKSGPVIPLDRKHVSLPRSTVVYSSSVPVKSQTNSGSYVNRPTTEEQRNKHGITGTFPGNFVKPSRPPPRIPAARPGRVVGPVLPYDNGLIAKDTYDGKTHIKNTPAQTQPQVVSPNCFLKPTNPTNQPNATYMQTVDPPQTNILPLYHMPSKPAAVMVDMNKNPYHPQQQYGAGQLTERVMIDTKLLQAQSQMDAINAAAAAAVAAHRHVGAVQFIDGH
ncbi:hypothetical protein QQ045_027291 [Rhodiola kirilowii]